MSSINNVKLDPNRQKLVECVACGEYLVVGKFSKKNQTCEDANYYPSKCPKKSNVRAIKHKSAKEKIAETKDLDESENISTVNKFSQLMDKLGFEADHNRRFKKKYGIDGGGVMTIYPFMEPGVGGNDPKLSYFSIVLQRAIGVNEDFRKFMPPDAASDCELMASELGEINIIRPTVGTTVCDNCGSNTDQFGVRRDKVYCVAPNNCFEKDFSGSGAEAEI